MLLRPKCMQNCTKWDISLVLKEAVMCMAAQIAHCLADHFTDKKLYWSWGKEISKYSFIFKSKYSFEGYFGMKTEVHTLPHQTIVELFCKKKLQNFSIIKKLWHEQQPGSQC